MCNSGIYAIINRVNGKYYIGSAVKLHRRRYKHISELRNKCHDNKHLEKAWHKYGEDNFKFVTLELVENKSKLLEREQFWLDVSECYNENKGYNLCKIAGNQLGIKRSDSWKANMSRVHKDKIVTKEQRVNISAATKLAMKNVDKNKLITNRNFDKWSCVKGHKCKCENCMEKKRERNRIQYKNKILNFVMVT